MERKRILITGAGGFIGGFIVEEAFKRGFEVWAGVRSTTRKDYLKQEELHFIDLDFSHPIHLAEQLKACKEQFGGWDYIVHNLGKTKETHKGDFKRVNYDFLKNFVEALQSSNCVPKQFIYMSSLASFGVGDETGHEPIRSTQKQLPYTEYGRSKLLSEEFLRSQKNFPYTILRPTGVYGPREKDYFMMIKCIRSGFDFSIGFKPQKLTFIYVKDLVHAIFLSIEKQALRKEYILSEERCYSGKEFREFVMELLPKRFVIPIKTPTFVVYFVSVIAEFWGKITKHPSTLNRDKYKIMRQRNWMCDTAPAKEELGFSAQYSLKEGLKEAIEWYKKEGWL